MSRRATVALEWPRPRTVGCVVLGEPRTFALRACSITSFELVSVHVDDEPEPRLIDPRRILEDA